MANSNNLIPVFSAVLNDEPTELCNARDLHATMQVGRDFSNWIKERIDTYGFIEGEDFILCSPNPASKKGRGGHNRSDYHLTLDMAKELAMVENNEHGRAVRRYFIRHEKAARAAGFKLESVINKAQLGELATLLAERFPVGKDRPYAWSRFNNHFRIASYKDLPADKFLAACEYINQMPVKTASALPATVNAENDEKTIIGALTQKGHRFMTVFGDQITLHSIPNDAVVLTPEEMIKHVGEAGAFPRALIPALIQSAAARLQ